MNLLVDALCCSLLAILSHDYVDASLFTVYSLNYLYFVVHSYFDDDVMSVVNYHGRIILSISRLFFTLCLYNNYTFLSIFWICVYLFITDEAKDQFKRVHHIITMLLLEYSTTFNYQEIGRKVLFYHMISDVPMFLVRYAYKEKYYYPLQVVLAVTTLVLWFYYRIYCSYYLIKDESNAYLTHKPTWVKHTLLLMVQWGIYMAYYVQKLVYYWFLVVSITIGVSAYYYPELVVNELSIYLMLMCLRVLLGLNIWWFGVLSKKLIFK